MNKEDSNKYSALKFLEDRDYKIQVWRDVGVYRHLGFKHEHSYAGSFEIITWPGNLCFTGDMGCFVFKRIQDMAYFFNEEINPSYWHQKVESQSVFGGGTKEFSLDLFIEQMQDIRSEAIERGMDVSVIDMDMYGLDHIEDEHEAVQFVRNLSLAGFDLVDLQWPTVYTFHYLFACYAINFACKTYLLHKENS